MKSSFSFSKCSFFLTSSSYLIDAISFYLSAPVTYTFCEFASAPCIVCLLRSFFCFFRFFLSEKLQDFLICLVVNCYQRMRHYKSDCKFYAHGRRLSTEELTIGNCSSFGDPKGQHLWVFLLEDGKFPQRGIFSAFSGSSGQVQEICLAESILEFKERIWGFLPFNRLPFNMVSPSHL